MVDDEEERKQCRWHDYTFKNREYYHHFRNLMDFHRNYRDHYKKHTQDGDMLKRYHQAAIVLLLCDLNHGDKEFAKKSNGIRLGHSRCKIRRDRSIQQNIQQFYEMNSQAYASYRWFGKAFGTG